MMHTIIRHMAAVLAAWLITTLVGALGLDVGPEDVAEMQAALTTLGTVLLLALYAVLEKSLKPMFERLGERRAAPLEPEVLTALETRRRCIEMIQQDIMYTPRKDNR